MHPPRKPQPSIVTDTLVEAHDGYEFISLAEMLEKGATHAEAVSEDGDEKLRFYRLEESKNEQYEEQLVEYKERYAEWEIWHKQRNEEIMQEEINKVNRMIKFYMEERERLMNAK